MNEKVNAMSELQPALATTLIARNHQPLIAVPVENNGEEEVRYFTDDAEADAALGQEATREAIKLAGVWSDLDGDDMLASLARMRHESKPTPPIESILPAVHSTPMA